LFSCDVQVNNH